MKSFGWTTAIGRSTAIFSIMLAAAMPAAAQDVKEAQWIEMDLGDFRFRPSTITIAVGDSAELILSNRDSFTPHSFVIVAPEAGMAVKADVGGGKSETVVLRPTKPGTYTFYCDQKLLFFPSHREKGMEGKIEVKAGS